MSFFADVLDNALVPNVSIEDLKQMKVGILTPNSPLARQSVFQSVKMDVEGLASSPQLF